jgi:hypothetical protein
MWQWKEASTNIVAALIISSIRWRSHVEYVLRLRRPDPDPRWAHGRMERESKSWWILFVYCVIVWIIHIIGRMCIAHCFSLRGFVNKDEDGDVTSWKSAWSCRPWRVTLPKDSLTGMSAKNPVVCVWCVCVFIVPAGRVVRRVVVIDLWMDCPRTAELNKEGRIRGLKTVVW